MHFSKLILSAAAGTTFMTLFSHLVAEIEDENFSEPLLLAKLLHSAVPAINKRTSKALGWTAHYAVGAAFAAPYQAYLSKNHKHPTVANSLIAGAAGGLAGIAMWKTTFKVHPLSPNLPYGKFYTQLFAAHLIFGLVTGATLRLLEKRSAEQTDNVPILPLSE